MSNLVELKKLEQALATMSDDDSFGIKASFLSAVGTGTKGVVSVDDISTAFAAVSVNPYPGQTWGQTNELAEGYSYELGALEASISSAVPGFRPKR